MLIKQSAQKVLKSGVDSINYKVYLVPKIIFIVSDIRSPSPTRGILNICTEENMKKKVYFLHFLFIFKFDIFTSFTYIYVKNV